MPGNVVNTDRSTDYKHIVHRKHILYDQTELAHLLL